uniref:Peptidase n=1 Tax=uncultured bacterium pAY4-1 TaxID=1781157 RepID=A0A1C9U4T4_9BACT|nr:peptidase [uncultured bacterium pAY4-1]
MTAFPARLFGPRLSGSGVAVTGAWQEDDSLRVVTPAGEWAATNLSITASGFNAERLKISWQGDDGEYALFVDNAAARALCLTEAPPLHAQLILAANQQQRVVERRFRLGGALLAGLLLLPLLLLGLLYLQQDAIAEWLIQRIPVQQEAQIGEAILAQSRLSMELIESGPSVEALRRIGEKLTADSPHRYRWFVANKKEINAFAAPGGIVVVNAGLLYAITSPEELAGVLAHEIAHAELRHSLKGIAKSLGLRTLASLALGDYGGTALAEGMKHLAELGFSREAEREADQEGLRRLVAARIDPQGMVRFFELLEKERQLTPPPFLSTHPSNAERITALQREIARLPKDWRPLETDLAAIRAGLPQP